MGKSGMGLACAEHFTCRARVLPPQSFSSENTNSHHIWRFLKPSKISFTHQRVRRNVRRTGLDFPQLSILSFSPLPRLAHLTVEAHDRPVITSLRLLAVLNVLFKYVRIFQETGRRAARALY